MKHEDALVCKTFENSSNIPFADPLDDSNNLCYVLVLSNVYYVALHRNVSELIELYSKRKY